MLFDAIASEAYKFLHNTSALFWGFFCVPLVVLAFHLCLETYLHLHFALPLPVDPGHEILGALALGGSSFIQIFFVAGAAAIFAGEYRWETWRLVTPRNSRFNLLAAKYAVYGMACAASLAALAIGAGLSSLYAALLRGMPLLPLPVLFAPQALGVFLVTWAELLVLGAFTALVAVATRAITGALLAGIFFSFAQGIGMAVVHPWEAPLKDFALFPDMSAYLLRAWVSGQEMAPGVFADPAKIVPAACFLAAWILVGGGAAAAFFQYQDLPRE